MSYEAVNRLSSRTTDGEINSFYVIPTKDYDSFQLPLPTLERGAKVCIRGCKKIWEVCNVNEQSIFRHKRGYRYKGGEVWILGTVSIKDEKGFYASIHRTDIERILESEEDEELFLSDGQLALF